MGTNVYAIRQNPRTLVDWKKLERSITNQDPWSLIDEVDRFEGTLLKNRVHLGKRSAGWKYVFNHNDWKYYDHTKESIDRFLRSCVWIEDEYGNILDPDTFWEDFGENNPDGKDNRDYFESAYYAELNNYYQATESPAGPIPRTLPYYFSDSTDFQ